MDNIALRAACAAVDFVVTSQEKKLAFALEEQGATVMMVSLTPQPGADAAFVAKERLVGAEVKSAGDLVSSFTGRQADGRTRLTSQFERMLANYDIVILFIRGTMAPDEDNRIVADGRYRSVSWDSLWNALLAWQRPRGQLDKGRGVGVYLQPALDLGHVAHRLLSIRRFLTR